MRAYDLIRKKRDGGTLSKEEIQALLEGYGEGTIPDYQMSAWLMAVFFQGMTKEETADLTWCMANSGDMLDLSGIHGRKIDKHSTGGVGDTTTLVLAPLVASCGVPVVKMSGRGLGHTGGTIDKLESIPGFRVDLTEQEFIQQVNQVKACVVGQTGELAPADKALYGLRDVTATVESLPLIASSIMSKKLASGADGLVLDVKTGRGAFMQELEDAVALAKAMVSIGTNLHRDTVALVTDMSQPLGLLIGNSLEVKEAILTLQGYGPSDLVELCLLLGTEMLLLAGVTETEGTARRLLKEKLRSKEALLKFKEMICAQGGDARVIEDLSLLPTARIISPCVAQESGYVVGIDSLAIGIAAMKLGAGRETKESVIDLSVGIALEKKVGDWVVKGEPLAQIHSNREDLLETAANTVQTAYTLGDTPSLVPPLFYQRITRDCLG